MAERETFCDPEGLSRSFDCLACAKMNSTPPPWNAGSPTSIACTLSTALFPVPDVLQMKTVSGIPRTYGARQIKQQPRHRSDAILSR